MSSGPRSRGGGSAGPSSTTWRRGEAVRGVPKPWGGGVARGDGARPGAVGPSCLAAAGGGLPGAGGEGGRHPGTRCRPHLPRGSGRPVGEGPQQVRVGGGCPRDAVRKGQRRLPGAGPLPAAAASVSAPAPPSPRGKCPPETLVRRPAAGERGLK